MQGLTQDADAVQLTVRDLAREQTWTAKARFVVACDGARSFTRKALGIALQDFHQDAAWLVVDAEAKGADPFPMWNIQVCHPARPTTFVHGRGSHLRWEFKLRPDEAPEAVLQPERLRELIRLAPQVGIDPAQITIERSAVYTFHATIAEQWQQGRVFLMGDAAHQMPPFLGQGACAGFRDAINLAWKLDMVLRGAAPAGLLSSYQMERRPHVQTIIQRVISFGSIIQTTNRMQAWARDRVLGVQALLGRAAPPADSIVPPLTGGLLADAPRSPSRSGGKHLARLRGTLMPQRPVTRPDGAVVPLDDALGRGFALVAWDCDPHDALSAEALARFGQIGGRVVRLVPAGATHVPETDCARDHTGELQEWFASQGIQIALVRPDRYLYGAGSTTQAPGLMEQLLAAVLTRPQVAA